MTPRDGLATALTALRANPMRSVLTSLGIIIGVGAVIIMIAIGAGAQRQVEAVIQNLGSNIIIVRGGAQSFRGVRGAAGSVETLTDADAQAIETEVDAVAIAAPSVAGGAQLVFGNNNWNSTVYGVTSSYLRVRNYEVAEGRPFDESEGHSNAKIAIIGRTVAQNLFGNSNPIGAVIRIGRVPFTVVGILEEKGQTPFGRDQDDIVFVPLAAARQRVLGGRGLGNDKVSSITLQVRSAARIDEAIRETTALLRQRHRIRPGEEDDFNIRNIASFMQARQESSAVMTILLASVAAISLIVGGIGIMNIMLVSVTERTREIGVRMAVGARRRDILSQFVLESLAVAVAGGLIGIVLGVGGSFAIGAFAGWPVLIEPVSILVATGFAAVVGVFFGLYPALQAARKNPIEALRYE